MIQILHNFSNSCIFIDIGRNCLLGNRKKVAKFLMRTLTCRSTFLYGPVIPFIKCNPKIMSFVYKFTKPTRNRNFKLHYFLINFTI